MVKTNQTLFEPIRSYIDSLSVATQEIQASRTEKLDQIAQFIIDSISTDAPPELIFICTHNSRRSHFGQIWAKVIADYFGYDQVQTYSGGTEATAFNPNAIEALLSIGFDIQGDTTVPNPRYEVRYGGEISPMTAWSKIYSDSANPQEGFCAIMTCNEADEACPIVFGAAKRVSLSFLDPKVSDGTPQQAETYALRCRQIATEVFFIFNEVHKRLST